MTMLAKALVGRSPWSNRASHSEPLLAQLLSNGFHTNKTPKFTQLAKFIFLIKTRLKEQALSFSNNRGDTP